jgi:hypothetical protein
MAVITLPAQTAPPDTTAGTDTLAVRYDSASIAVRHPSDEVLRKYMDDDDFIYDRPRPEPSSFWEIVTRWIGSQLAQLFSGTSPAFWKIVGYLILGATMVFVTMKLIGIEPDKLFRKTDKETSLDIAIEDENIHAMDFDALLEQAIRSRDYRWAIRLHYLRLLKQLTDRNMIAWRPDKTNHDYLYELQRDDLRAQFVVIITLFEYAWYGNMAPNREAYVEAEALFDEFKQQVVAG